MKASIIIPTSGHRLDYLTDTLNCLGEVDFPRHEYEIIVVDNSRDQKVGLIVKQAQALLGSSIFSVFESRDGLHHARHAGAKAAQGDILIYLDDDVLLPPYWLKAILGPFEDPQVACSGGKVIAKWEGDKPDWLEQFDVAYLSLIDYGDSPKELKTSSIWGCNMAVRRSSFFEVGGSNVDFFKDKKNFWFAGDGECGLEDKLLRAGYKIMYIPDAWVHHRIPQSRLSPMYYYRRFKFTGVHDGYTYVRNNQSDPFLILKLFYRAGRDMAKSAYRLIQSKFYPDRQVRLYADSIMFNYRARHALLTIFNRKLRDHIVKDSYL